ncbi:50S ribosomal protein L10 [archaeon]|nr:50S ribosomal protein L10 [archaeon]
MAKQVVENIPKKKLNAVKELIELISSHKTILVADIGSIPGSQFQSISKKLRGKAIVKVPKRNLFFRAVEQAGKKEALGLKDQIDGAVAVLFSNLDSYELAAELLKNKSAAKAKTGQIAPFDIEVPAGPTDLTPGPAISELGALGIQIMIQGGKIEIKAPKIVAKSGEPIKQNAADMLGKLNILPFTIGFKPLSAYDSQTNTIYVDIKIDTEGTLASLLDAYARALPFAVEIGYLTNETVKVMIGKAARQERRLVKVITGEPDEVIVKEAPVEEIKQEEKKEEPKADFAASFF